FIPEASIEELKKSKIDLRKVTGKVQIDCGIGIPLRPSSANNYDIKADLSDMNLKIFDGNVELSQGKLQGSFNGKAITLGGTGKVNDYPSNLSYKMNFDPKAGFDHNLHITTQFSSLAKHKYEALSILSGKTSVDLDYTKKGIHSALNLSSDLKNIEFEVKKIGLHKAMGKRARLTVEGHSDDVTPSHFDIKLIGEGNLKIIGALDLKDDAHTLRFSSIKYLESDMKADIVLGKNALKAKIYGDQLDLSNVELGSYVDNATDDKGADLNINIKKIKLKNNIWLDSFVMRLKCDKTHCYEGEMDSNIGTRTFRMALNKKPDCEEWTITTTNAGALLSALGLYDKVRSGSLLLTMETNKKYKKIGETRPEIQGHFALKKFVTVDAPFVTRMVSFISLPGLLSTMTDNKNISFTTFDGGFDYKDGVIRIKNAAAEGGFLNFTMSGLIDTNKHQAKLRGGVVPSLYGINSIVRHIPILGKLLSGGRRKGLIFAPYAIKQNY
ncbi:MAG: AsmA-like C-terminal region-containing protein, partial [Pseudomonadota bacterium]